MAMAVVTTGENASRARQAVGGTWHARGEARATLHTYHACCMLGANQRSLQARTGYPELRCPLQLYAYASKRVGPGQKRKHGEDQEGGQAYVAL